MPADGGGGQSEGSGLQYKPSSKSGGHVTLYAPPCVASAGGVYKNRPHDMALGK